ncbi:MAG: hypothetical protein AAGH15_13965 [Myxococcota bacterium]
MTQRCLLGALVLLLLHGSSADAQRTVITGAGKTIQGLRPDVHVSLGYGDFGVGFRLDIPVMQPGPLRNARTRVADELAVSVGLDLMFVDFDDEVCRNAAGDLVDCDDLDVGVWPTAVVQWNVYLNERWSLLSELGLALLIGETRSDRPGDDFDIEPVINVGARLHSRGRLGLLLRAGYPTALQVGMIF